MTASNAARVLTVDDDPIVRADLRLILEDAGFDVVPDARDGIEAVEFAREHRPDLILIDLSLPRVDGVEATRRILEEHHVPIVALTGHSTGGYIERALEAGAVAHVLKPFHDAHLVGTIRGALAEHVSRDGTDVDSPDDATRLHYMLLIESMVREGASEPQIVEAVRGSYSWDREFGTRVALSSWIRALLGR